MSKTCEAAVTVAALVIAATCIWWVGTFRERSQVLVPVFFERSSVESSGDKAATSGSE